MKQPASIVDPASALEQGMSAHRAKKIPKRQPLSEPLAYLRMKHRYKPKPSMDLEDKEVKYYKPAQARANTKYQSPITFL